MADSRVRGVWAIQERIRRAPQRRRRILLGCALLVVAALVGHMVIVALTTPPPPTSLRVQRIAGPVHAIGSVVYVIQPLDHTLTDPGTVQHLYSLALGLHRPSLRWAPARLMWKITF